jgi:Short C-terminal domain
MILPMGRRFRRRRILVGGAALLLVGGAAYKLGQSQAQQIEEHTGKPPEDLTQAELEQAMDDLGIEEQELTQADQAAIEAEAVDGPAPAAFKPPGQPDYIDQLTRLAGLKDAGIITEEEFQAKKKQLLGL